MHLSSYRQRAFTLIEIMAVLAIAAILATLAFPAYRHATLKAAPPWRD